MGAYTLELSGAQHFNLIATIEMAISAAERDINDFLREFPWSDYGWSIEDLLGDPGQIRKVDPDDENMGSDLRGLIYDLRDANELLAMLTGLPGRCEGCGSPAEQLHECDKAYLCLACAEKWENE
jgi:hypothetical protein